MRRSQSLYLALLISILVCCGSDAQSREPVYCYPPTVTAVAPGQGLQWKGLQGAVGLLLPALVLSPVFDFANEPRVM
jgi:hypothetical protein